MLREKVVKSFNFLSRALVSKPPTPTNTSFTLFSKSDSSSSTSVPDRLQGPTAPPSSPPPRTGKLSLLSAEAASHSSSSFYSSLLLNLITILFHILDLLCHLSPV